MKFLNAKVWVIVFGAIALVGGALNAVAAESVAIEGWGELDSGALDIATALEVAWGVMISVWGASIIVLALLLQGASRARFGVVSVLAFNLSQIVAVGGLSNLGYGSNPPLLFILVPVLVSVATLVACARDWKPKSDLATAS